MTVVSLRQDPLFVAAIWARQNCHSYVSMAPIIKHDGYCQHLQRVDYSFNNEQDAVMFALRWS